MNPSGTDRRGRRDDRAQGVAQRVQLGGVGRAGVGLVGLDVEGVDGDAALGVDAGEGRVEAVVGDRLHQAVEQADLVVRLHLDDDAVERELVVDLDGRREGRRQLRGRGGGVARGLGKLLRLGGDVGQQVAVVDQRLLDRAGEGVHGLLVLDDAAAGLDDVEGVDGDVVGAGGDLGGEDAQAGDAEGARELVEEAGAVPGDDVHRGVAAVDVVLPLDDRLERAQGVGRRDGVQQPVDHLDVQRDLGRVGLDEIALGQEVEMRGDLVRADAGDGLGDEGLAGHFDALAEAGFNFIAEGQALKRGVEQAPVQ